MEEQDAFFVVRKGNTIAVYSTLKDCQDQVGPSICDPAVSVYKGYSLSTETEAFLAAKGLKNAIYTIDVADVKEDLFGALLPCNFQDVNTSNSVKRELRYENHHKVDMGIQGSSFEEQPVSIKHMECTLEFNGASKGNPGKYGAGAVIRTEDGRAVAVLREGLGDVSDNVAELKALIMGLKYALEKGFKKIRVQGNSQLVCMQVQGLWPTKNHSFMELFKEVKELREKFLSFEIKHVQGEHNTFAAIQAKLAIDLPAGEVYVECDNGF